MNRQEAKASSLAYMYGNPPKIESIYIPPVEFTESDIPAEDYDEARNYSFGLAGALRAQVIVIGLIVVAIGVYFAIS